MILINANCRVLEIIELQTTYLLIEVKAFRFFLPRNSKRNLEVAFLDGSVDSIFVRTREKACSLKISEQLERTSRELVLNVTLPYVVLCSAILAR